MIFDGCFPDAHTVLTEEEYFAKVLFDNALMINRDIFRMANLKKIFSGL
jgi:hypothetical protein